MSKRAIVTHYDPKPIPMRQFDWQAARDGYDMGEPIGYGRTEQDAITDLLELEEDTETIEKAEHPKFPPEE